MQRDQVLVDALKWANEASEEVWIKAEPPKALAGQNKVLMLSSKRGTAAVLRVSPGHQAWARSGAWIKSRLLAAGLPVPKEIASHFLDDHSSWASLQTMIPGEDLSVCWRSLNEAQAIKIAEEVAGLVSGSFDVFGDLNPGDGHGRFAPPLGEKVATSVDWYAFCDRWLEWAGGRAMQASAVSHEEMCAMRMALARLHEPLQTSSVKAFVWDAGDRNVMVDDGKFSGLVDQDELMMGDPWVAPGLALAQLTILGVPWAERYVDAWVRTWGGSDAEASKMTLYAALWSIQIAAKKGKMLPDGRVESACPDGILEKFRLKL